MKTFLGLVARCLPYHVVEEKPEDRIISRDQAIEELKERGLPIEMLVMLRPAPEPLDPNEIENPYGETIDREAIKVTETPLGGPSHPRAHRVHPQPRS